MYGVRKVLGFFFNRMFQCFPCFLFATMTFPYVGAYDVFRSMEQWGQIPLCKGNPKVERCNKEFQTKVLEIFTWFEAYDDPTCTIYSPKQPQGGPLYQEPPPDVNEEGSYIRCTMNGAVRIEGCSCSPKCIDTRQKNVVKVRLTFFNINGDSNDVGMIQVGGPV